MFFLRKIKKKSKIQTVDLAYLNKRTPIWKPILFLLPAIILIAFFTVYPLFYSVNLGIQNDIQSKYTGENFTEIFNDVDFIKSLTNSLLYTIFQLPISIAISLIISSAIASLIRKWLRGTMQTIFFLPYVTSGIAVSIGFAYMFESGGFINSVFNLDTRWLEGAGRESYTALVVMVINGIWRALAFQILIFTTAMLTVDKDRYRSASIDGAGPVTQFFTITLPSIKRTFNFIMIVGLIGAIKVFPLALFDNNVDDAFSNGGGTLMLYVYLFVRGQTVRLEMAGAASIILLVVSIVYSSFIRNSFKLAGRFFAWRVETKTRMKVNKYLSNIETKKISSSLKGAK